MRDSEIEQWVLNEIRLTTDGRLKEVCVLSVNGLVNLKGTVPTRADRVAVQKAAEQAKNVIGVINQLNVRKRNLIKRRGVVKSRVTSTLPAFHFSNHEPVRSSQAAS